MTHYYQQTAKPSDYVYRIYDPETGLFLASGHGMYSKNRSVWVFRYNVVNTFRNLSPELQARAEIKKYRLVEVEE